MSASNNKTYRVYCFDGVHKALTHDLIEAPGDDDFDRRCGDGRVDPSLVRAFEGH